jgi:hypothetical protein
MTNQWIFKKNVLLHNCIIAEIGMDVSKMDIRFPE